MSTLIQLTLIGFAVFLEIGGDEFGYAFGFAIFLASAYTVFHWFDKYQIMELKAKVAKLELLVASKTHYIAALNEHRKKLEDR